MFLRNRLKYALTYDEVKKIVNQRLVKVDGKVRTDKTYPAGFMGLHFCSSIMKNLCNELQILIISFYFHPGVCVTPFSILHLVGHLAIAVSQTMAVLCYFFISVVIRLNEW